jgi:O-methyltransferase
MAYARYFGRLARHAGYSVAKGLALPLVRREAVRSGAHELAFPIATYAPWRSDPEFRTIYDAARRHTLVDVWRCYELWSLLGELREVPGSILEVGVWRGGTGALLAARAAGLGIDDRVYLCDTWRGVVKSGDIDRYYYDGKHDDASSTEVTTLLSDLGLSNVELLEGIFPEETGPEISEQTFRLCHCDVDVYQSARDVLDWVWLRLAPGGVVVFDDYGFPACPGVTKLVDEQRLRDDRLVLHNLNGHGIIVKR